MAVGVPGEEVSPSDFVSVDFDLVTIGPTPSSSAAAIALNGGYTLYSDNAGAGANNTRVWLDAPDDGEVIIGPRSGGSNLAQIRLRHDKISGVLGVVLRQDTNGVLYLTSSSRRYKLEIQDHDIDLDALARLRVVHFKDRTQIEDAARRIAPDPHVDPTDAEYARAQAEAPWYMGVIAEEVDELGLSEFVTYEDDPDNPGQQRANGFRYELVALGALQLIRRQDQRIDALEQRLAAMERRT